MGMKALGRLEELKMGEKLTDLAKRLRPFLHGAGIPAIFAGAEGPGIDIPAGTGVIGLGGDTILLCQSDGDPVGEFAATDAGLELASAAAASGDVIKLPACTIAGAHTLTAGVAYKGIAIDQTILTGTITGASGASLHHCSVTVAANTSGYAYGVYGPSSGIFELWFVLINVTQAGAGSGVALGIDDGDVEGHKCSITADDIAIARAGDGDYYSHQDKVSGTTICQGLSGEIQYLYDWDADLEGWAQEHTPKFYSFDGWVWAGYNSTALTWDSAHGHTSNGCLQIATDGKTQYGVEQDHDIDAYVVPAQTTIVHEGDVVSAWIYHWNEQGIWFPGRSFWVNIQLRYTDNTFTHEYTQWEVFADWHEVTLTVPAGDEGKTIAKICVGLYIGGSGAYEWSFYDSIFRIDDLVINGHSEPESSTFYSIGSEFDGALTGEVIPLWGDRSAWDVVNYPDRHARDINDGTASYHLPPVGDDGDILTVVGGTPAWGAIPALDDHDHSGDAGDGGTFDAANLTSGTATDGYVLTADGSGGAAWEEVTAAGGGRWEPLTDGDEDDPEFIFNDGDVLMVEII